MPLKPTDLQAGALNAWTPLQQAALWRRHAAEQSERDEKQAAADEKKKAKEKAEAEKKADAPDAVKASVVLEGFIKSVTPELVDFLDIFGPPYLVFPVLLLLHGLFWTVAPSYLRFLLYYPAIYIVPAVQTQRTLFSKERRSNRPMWQAYWAILGMVEYLESCLFGEHRRALVVWPILKAIFCVWQYSILGPGQNAKKHTMMWILMAVQGSIRLIGPLVPEPPEDKPKEKADGKSEEKRSSKDSRSSRPK